MVKNSVGFLFIYLLLFSFLSRALMISRTNVASVTIKVPTWQKSITLSYPVISGLQFIKIGGSAYCHRSASIVYDITSKNARYFLIPHHVNLQERIKFSHAPHASPCCGHFACGMGEIFIPVGLLTFRGSVV